MSLSKMDAPQNTTQTLSELKHAVNSPGLSSLAEELKEGDVALSVSCYVDAKEAHNEKMLPMLRYLDSLESKIDLQNIEDRRMRFAPLRVRFCQICIYVFLIFLMYYIFSFRYVACLSSLSSSDVANMSVLFVYDVNLYSQRSVIFCDMVFVTLLLQYVFHYVYRKTLTNYFLMWLNHRVFKLKDLILYIMIWVPGFYVQSNVVAALTIKRKPRFKSSKELRDTIVIRCGNVQNNVAVLNKWYNSFHDVYILRLRGYTEIDGIVFPFPVYCDVNTLIRVYSEFQALDNSVKRRILACEFDYNAKQMFRPCFARVLNSTAVMLTCVPENGSLHVQMRGLLNGLFSYFMQSYCMLSILVPALSIFAGDTILYVLLEELFNERFTIVPVVLFEILARSNLGLSIWLNVVVLHLFLSFIPLPLRVLIHWIWNVHAIYVGERVLAGSIDYNLIATIAKIADLLRKIAAQDAVGVALSITMEFPTLCELFKEHGDCDFNSLHSLVGELVPESAEVLLNRPQVVEEETAGSFLYSWVPIGIRKSPTFRRLMAFIMLVFSTSYFKKYLDAFTFGKYLQSEDFQNDGSIIDTIIRAVSACFSAADRVIASGDFSAFWDMSPDVHLLTRGAEIMASKHRLMSDDEIVCELVEAKMLIDKRKYLKNDQNCSRMVEKLRLFIESKSSYLEALKTRKCPLIVWLLGQPGTGKTTLLQLLCDYFAARDKVPRCAGDVIIFNIFDKFPGSAGINKYARFLFCNDIPAIYTDFDKRDLIPLDILLQQVLDTFPFYIRAAAVEDKGLVLLNLEYVIVTSNHWTYRMSGETEKLQRRLENGILVNVDFKTSKSKRLNFKETTKFDQGERNDIWSFEILDVDCSQNFIKFTSNGRNLRLAGFLDYCAKTSDAWNKRCSNDAEKFSASAKRCKCGLVTAIHECSIENPRVVDLIVTNVENKRIYQCFSKECEDFYADEYVEKDVFLGYIPYVYGQMTGNVAMYWANFILLCYLVYNLELCQAFVNVVDVRAKSYLRRSIYPYIYMSDWCDSFAQRTLSTREYYFYRMNRRFVQFKRFVEDYYQYIGAVGLAGLLYKSMRAEDIRLLTKPIYQSDVDPNSLNFINYRTEINYPLAKLREWNKEAKVIKIAEFVKKGVGLSDLNALANKAILNVTFKYTCDVDANGLRTFNKRDVRLFQVTPEYVLFNKHYIPNGVTQEQDPKFIFEGLEYSIDLSKCLGDDTCELYVYRHNFPTFARGIHTFMLENEAYWPCKVNCEITDSAGVTASPAVFTGADGQNYRSLRFPGKSVDGNCSSPVIATFDGGCALIGLISYGNSDYNYVGCTLISREWFDRMLSKNPFPIVEDVKLLARDGLTELDMASDGRNFVSPYLIPVGTIPGNHSSFSSDFRRTQIYDKVVNSGRVKTVFDIPKHMRVVKDGVYYSSLLHMVKNVNYGTNLLETEEDAAIKDYVKRFDVLKDVKLGFLTFGEAIFGNPSLGIDRVDFKTSCGSLLKTLGVINKYDLFGTYGDSSLFFKEEIAQLVTVLDQDLEKHIASGQEVDAVGKDEIRDKEKLDLAKIRIFTVLNFVYNIWGRMALMPLITLMLQNPVVSECYGGMNAGSSEWNDLANLMLRRKNFFDADFSTFDATHARTAFRIFSKVCYLLCMKFGMTQALCAKIYIFVMCLCWQLFRYKNDLFVKLKGMPSGVIITLILNSVVNSIMARIVFNRLRPNNEQFSDCVTMATVGDDNISGVENAPWFNMLSIKDEYLKLGYVVTPANKQGVPQKYIPFEDLTFVKRRFSYNSELGYIAPIETDSIYKGLMFEKKQCGVSPEQRLCDVIEGAQREYFLHGYDKFISFRAWISNVISEYRLPAKLLDYSDLRREYEDKNFRTFMC